MNAVVAAAAEVDSMCIDEVEAVVTEQLAVVAAAAEVDSTCIDEVEAVVTEQLAVVAGPQRPY